MSPHSRKTSSGDVWCSGGANRSRVCSRKIHIYTHYRPLECLWRKGRRWLEAHLSELVIVFLSTRVQVAQLMRKTLRLALLFPGCSQQAAHSEAVSLTCASRFSSISHLSVSSGKWRRRSDVGAGLRLGGQVECSRWWEQ